MEHQNTNWHALETKQVFKKLKSKATGISNKEAKQRRKLYGLNRLAPPKKQSLFIRFLLQFHNILIYILLIAAVITLLLQHWVDAGVIFGVVILNAIVGSIQEGKAEKALDAIKNMLSPMASVLRDGIRRTVEAETLVPGDVVLLQAGDKIPADLRLFETKNLQLQEAILTGESNPVEKDINPVTGNLALGDRTSIAFSGTVVTYGTGKGVVVATGQNTEIGRISSMLTEVKTITTPLTRQMGIFSRWLTLAIVAMALITFLVGALGWGDSAKEMFMAAVGLAVAAIPEGLPAIVTITLAIGVTKMAKRNAIIRRLPAVETMGSVATICTDKTGTLTHNELSVQNIITAKHNFHVTGSGYNPHGEILLNKTPVAHDKHPNLQQALIAGILCNDAELNPIEDMWELSGNPTDGALLSLGLKAKLDFPNVQQIFPRTDLIPFDSKHKFMATLHHDHEGKGYIFVKGAPEKILSMCAKQRVTTKNTTIDKEFWQKQIKHLAEEGKRVVAIAVKHTKSDHRNLSFDDIGHNLTLLCILGIIDPPREEAILAVAECQKAGIKVKMITGDHAITAKTIAEQVGISKESGVLTGVELDELSDIELNSTVNEIDIYARTSPEHKLRLVQALQANNSVVAMTGDGVNDAPALRQAEIGVAMGQKGTEATKEVADMVLADDNFASIKHAVEEGRTVYDNIKKAILFILPTNGGQAFSVVLAIMLGYVLPITAVQILWVNMVTAVTLALALGFEESEANIMRRKPRAPNEPILSKFLMWRILFVSFLLVACVFGLFVYERHINNTDLIIARTIAINMLVVGEIFYLISCRKIFASAFNFKVIFGSKPIWIAIGSVVILQLLFTYLPIMQKFFGTEAIGLRNWLYILILGFLVFVFVEIEKIFMRRHNHKKGSSFMGTVKNAASK